MTKIAVCEADLNLIKNILTKYLPKAKFILFGSRVNGNNQPYSDLDIAIKDNKKIDLVIISAIKEDFANSDLKFIVDISDYHRVSEEFKLFLDSQQVFYKKSQNIPIILFGQNGQVASDLIKIFTNKPNFTIHNYSSKDVDFTNISHLKQTLANLPKADFIINATAYNGVDKAEDEKEKADLINHKAVKEIAKYCQHKQIKFIHYSSNYVFDGKGNKPYKENNTQNLKPLSTYGQTKLDGEKAIIKAACDYLILRVATVFNVNKDNNFVAKIKKLAQSNNELKIVTDQITNPTDSFDIARATINIIEQITQKKQFTSNIYHLAMRNPVSYYHFTQKIIKNLKKEVKITPVATDHFPTKAKRPLNGALDVDKIKNDFGIKINDPLKNTYTKLQSKHKFK